jgi:hypothetical protein
MKIDFAKAPKDGPTRLADRSAFRTYKSERKDIVGVNIIMKGQPYFPWASLDKDEQIPLLDKELQDTIFKFTSDMSHPDFTADIRLTFMRNILNDGVLRYSLSGSHSGFPAYELYVNGEESYRWGSGTELDDGPRASGRAIQPLTQMRPVKLRHQ